uniref:Reverse transcriptase domain-containing protein n=1 Tax=Oryzias sinensis TaxID=183150 RepID=A0A8C7XUM2_9TELE
MRRQILLSMASKKNNTFSSTVTRNHNSQRDLNGEQTDLKIFSDNDNNLQDIDPDQFFSTVNMDCKYYSIDDFKNSVNPEEKLSIIHFNSRSMYTNFEDIKDYLQNIGHSFDIITISETWFSHDKDADFELENYELNYVNRVNKKGGGVAIYVEKNTKFTVIDKLSVAVDGILECLTVEICNNSGKNVIISCVYRSPGSSLEVFSDWMEKMFTSLNNKILYICGDFNIDLINPSKHKGTDDFISRMYGMSLYPTITRPSRITTQSATLIDNIFTNNIEYTHMSGLMICDITDHLPVFALFDINVKTKKIIKEPVYKRLRNEKTMNALNNDLSRQNWNSVYREKDVDIAYKCFLEIFRSLYNKNCPIYKFKNKYAKCPWLTAGLQNACKKKNNLYKKFLKQRTRESEQRYKSYKNKLTEITRYSKKVYFNNLLNENKYNVKRVWEILNNIIKNGTKKRTYPDYFTDEKGQSYDINEAANGLNNYFVNVGPELAAEIPKCKTSKDNNPPIDRIPHSIFLSDVNENELISIVNNFKSKNSKDCEDIDMKVVKKVIHSVAKPLTYICNLSLQTGRFPNQMKIAKVIPIYKSGDKHQFTNYRPVSLLPQFSKILEKIFNDKLALFIEKYNIINENQYGFRENRSTSLAIIDAVEEITNALDKKKYAAGIFIDLKKAFDTLNHDILLDKLEVYGIRGLALTWVKSYLMGRKQFVKIDEYTSETKEIRCGVPQGSILGPLLFNIYINDIFNVSKLMKLILFADDTNIFYSTDNQRELIKVVNTELNNIKLWMDYNKLSLNLNKTKVMFFGNYNTNKEPSIVINNVLIERVTEIKFLGVFIDDKLSWKPHIRHIQTKVSKSISIVNKSKHILGNNSRYLLYCSLILPYFTYCIEIWGNNYKSSLHSLFLLQKQAVRVVHKAGYLDHTNNLFYQSRLLKLHDLVDFYTAQLLYRASWKLLPSNIQKQFLENEGGYRLRGCRNFKIKLIRTTKKSFCVSVCGTKLWNSLSNELKQCSNIQIFKKMYKE